MKIKRTEFGSITLIFLWSQLNFAGKGELRN